MNEIFIDDNINVLSKFLKEKRLFKMIYIDPPYNTKSTFSYDDNLSSINWAEMMESRLLLSRDLLQENGVIFISIDDNELYNLKTICDKVFGSKNFVGNLITKQAQRSNAKHINTIHEYVLTYAKKISKLNEFKISRLHDPDSLRLINILNKSISFLGTTKEKEKELKKTIDKLLKETNKTWIRNYVHVDEDNKIYFAKDLSTPGKPRRVEIPEIGLTLEPLKTRSWSSDKKFIQLHKDMRLHFKSGRPYEIHYLEDAYDNVSSILDYYSRQGTEDLKKLGLSEIFDTPKPVELIKYLIRIGTTEIDDKVLDFFAGSGTTAQAVVEINKEDKKNLSFVLVQIDEKINPKTIAYEKCKSLNLHPTIDQLMLLRIEKVLSKSEFKLGYKLYNKEMYNEK